MATGAKKFDMALLVSRLWYLATDQQVKCSWHARGEAVGEDKVKFNKSLQEVYEYAYRIQFAQVCGKLKRAPSEPYRSSVKLNHNVNKNLDMDAAMVFHLDGKGYRNLHVPKSIVEQWVVQARDNKNAEVENYHAIKQRAHFALNGYETSSKEGESDDEPAFIGTVGGDEETFNDPYTTPKQGAAKKQRRSPALFGEALNNAIASAGNNNAKSQSFPSGLVSPPDHL